MTLRPAGGLVTRTTEDGCHGLNPWWETLAGSAPEAGGTGLARQAHRTWLKGDGVPTARRPARLRAGGGQWGRLNGFLLPGCK